ncbi:hypothetical protein FB446DRAFT_734639 [Lentinula raphanica]|nr:hypothetical protein FB446DRAFT_734639 [Lentinula raphanica]
MQHSYIHSSGRRLSKLTLTLLLLVTIVGVCSASPLPEKAREDRSGYSDLLSEEYVEKAGKTKRCRRLPTRHASTVLVQQRLNEWITTSAVDGTVSWVRETVQTVYSICIEPQGDYQRMRFGKNLKDG